MNIEAYELSGLHLEKWIAFRWNWPVSDVATIVFGEAREIHHYSDGRVRVLLRGNESQGDHSEFTIEPSVRIWVCK